MLVKVRLELEYKELNDWRYKKFLILNAYYIQKNGFFKSRKKPEKAYTILVSSDDFSEINFIKKCLAIASDMEYLKQEGVKLVKDDMKFRNRLALREAQIDELKETIKGFNEQGVIIEVEIKVDKEGEK